MGPLTMRTKRASSCQRQVHDSRTWVPLRRVLNVFAETDNVSQANKLLLLDAGKLSQVWSLGIIFPTFPRTWRH